METVHTDRISTFLHRVENRIEGSIHTDTFTRAIYATDASLYELMPAAVLIPKTVDDIRIALNAARETGLPLTSRGAATSLAGQTVGSGLIIDFSRHLDRILEVNPQEKWARVEPGVIHSVLNAHLAQFGLLYGPDPATSNRATFGGIVANNSTGTHSILYGSAIDHIKSMRVLLADGTETEFSSVDESGWKQKCTLTSLEGDIYRKMDDLIREKRDVIERDTPEHWRRQGGYRIERLLNPESRNLSHLVCGSEGTLVIILDLTLNLVPLPKLSALGVVHFPTRRSALEAVTAILKTDPSAVELFDQVGIERCREVADFARRLDFVDGAPGALLITEYYGESLADLETKLDELDNVLSQTESYSNRKLFAPEQIKNVWDIRKAGLGLVMGVKGENKPVAFIEDASVPVEHLADYIAELENVLSAEETRSVMYAHASAGCLHVRPFVNPKTKDGLEKMRRIARSSATLVKKYHGIISSEHGDGQVRAWLGPEFYGEDLYDVYRRVKNIFDPSLLLNPGKIVDAPDMLDNHRFGEGYQTVPIKERLAYHEDVNLAGAIELCNGSGDCRKLESGTMCPSFMATRNEKHSTRGRANALRAAISGRLPADSFTDRRMHEVMELCVSCKACKAECPSSVDMAKLKFEWLDHYHEANGIRLRDRLFGNLPQLARWVAGPFAPVVNFVASRKIARWFLHRALGIHPQKPLPAFARKSFTKRFRAIEQVPSDKTVVLFNDTFNTYLQPEVCVDAVSVLNQIGYKVILPNHTCCGRPFISKGFVEKARQAASKTVESLYPLAEQGYPIVGLEPSCLLSFQDEYRSLLPGDERVEVVAAASVTFEEFIASCKKRGELDSVNWESVPINVMVHGHCHQKSLVGMAPSAACLGSMPGTHVDILDTSCCGMAGSFGYESEHSDVSQKMVERVLAPSVRAAGAETVVCASGISCRDQIHFSTNKEVVHPATVLARAMGSGKSGSNLRIRGKNLLPR